MLDDEVLKDEITHNVEVVRFHLECARAAVGRPRYYPQPPMYLQDIDDKATTIVLKLFDGNRVHKSMTIIAKHAISRKRKFDWIAACAEELKINEVHFTMLMHFVVFSCRLRMRKESLSGFNGFPGEGVR